MNTIKINQISAEDLNKCLFIIHKSFETVAYEFGLTEKNCPKHPSFMKIETLQSRFDQGYLMFGIYENEQFVGYVSLSKEDENVAELHNLSILPEYRHKGYGKELLKFCKSKAKALNCTIIRIDIIEENSILKNWYLENGFVHILSKQFHHLPFSVGFMEMQL